MNIMIILLTIENYSNIMLINYYKIFLQQFAEVMDSPRVQGNQSFCNFC